MSETALWSEKYRPKSLDEYIWPSDNIKHKFMKWFVDPSDMPHMILEGPPGCGKTSLVRLLGTLPNVEFFEIDAATDNGIDTIRRVKEFCEFGGFSDFKIVYFDEIERFTNAAQQGLKKPIEDYGAYTRFIFSCNNSMNIDSALRSRMRTFDFGALDEEPFVEKLMSILDQENIIYDTENGWNTITKIFETYYPDMRKCIDMLQDSVDGNTLSSEADTVKYIAEWQEEIKKTITGEHDIALARQIVAALNPAEMEKLYVYMYENSSELFGEHEPTCILIIADHLYRHRLVSFPEINLLAALIKIYEILEE